MNYKKMSIEELERELTEAKRAAGQGTEILFHENLIRKINHELQERPKREARNSKAAARRKEREEIMRSYGLVKVKGAMSGETYWE